MPTCDRAEMAYENVKKLKQAEKIVLCVNNCDIKPYTKFKWRSNVFIQDMTFIKGEPKLCHNRTFRMMIQIKANLNMLILEDDCTPCDDFIPLFSKMIKSIPDKEFTLSPIWIPEKRCRYTDAVEEKYKYGEFDFVTQKYVDGNFYMTSAIHEGMKNWILNDVPVRSSNSGISPVISNRIHKEGYKMYRTNTSLVAHGDHHSVQFGERRKLVPLIAKF